MTELHEADRPQNLEAAVWVNSSAKGEYRGHVIYKYEGVAGIRLTREPYWYAVRDGRVVDAHSARRGLIAAIDILADETPEQRAMRERVTALLGR